MHLDLRNVSATGTQVLREKQEKGHLESKVINDAQSEALLSQDLVTNFVQP